MSWRTILESTTFYLVETPYYLVETMITEMTADLLAPADMPTADSFCPEHARLPAAEPTS